MAFIGHTICVYEHKRISEEEHTMVDIFKALADETRLRMLALICDDEMCVCEIEKSLNLTQSNASRHLTVLKNAEILSSFKKAQWTYYRINEKFKSDNNFLWEYLQHKLKSTTKYQEESDKCKVCKEQNLCNNKRDSY